MASRTPTFLSTNPDPTLKTMWLAALPMPQYQFHLDITPDEFLEYYRGTARHVLAEDTNGKTVQFPASLLQKYVMPDGIHGDFILTCDDHHKVVNLQKV
jgi:hypothetical protein